MKLLIIDPNISASSPSMKGVVRSLPALRRAGFEIELWCWECDEGLEVDRIDRLPRVGAVRVLYTHVFGLWARLRGWWRFRVRRQPRPDVIYTVAWYFPDSDVCHVHFSPWDWERRQRALGTRSLRDAIERLSNRLGLFTAARFLRTTRASSILCVSDAVAADVRAALDGRPARLEVLPNSFDPARFHAGVRDAWRQSTRERLGWGGNETVFIFVSTGHYRRKGFFLAAEAVARLRQSQTHGSSRLLVVGGTESRLRRLRTELDRTLPGWRDFISFTGNVTDVERCFAAADALLFPSYSEAFALVEVEAAACGLPLFLTRHHGSEMILRDGVNGRFLEFDGAAIAGVLADFVSGAWKPSGAAPGRVPDSETYARLLAEELLGVVARRAANAGLPSPPVLASAA